MYPKQFTHNNKNYYLMEQPNSVEELKDLLLTNPYEIYAILNESTDQSEEPMLTTFLALYNLDFKDKIIFFDVSRQPQSTLTTELWSLPKGFIEKIDVGRVDRYPIKFYKGSN
ncbi:MULTISPECIES: hypothetical protein [Bacillaceae]|uniref:Uncharacterized protein n=1 Tax=Halalkalibacter alkaliphilus TaxID=2917993 RepID=A0A9X2CS88_9BACI|nr:MULTISPECIES: hypothetical protein [Bacillaceae]MCL7747312.1 hypothetical protein [Halalkalibacter alkaliphilus]MDT8862231.1 hypothetical protein [Alkalihalobacillus sp. MEB130]